MLLDRMAQIMIEKRVISLGVVTLQMILAFIVVFLYCFQCICTCNICTFVQTCKGTSVTYNVTIQIKRRAALPVGSGNWANRRFLAG